SRCPDGPAALRPTGSGRADVGFRAWRPCAAITLSWPASGAREDDKLLGRPGHGDVAVDRSLDARAERLRVDEDDQVEFEPLRQLRGQRPDAGRAPERGIADDAGNPFGVCGEPGAEDRA